MLPPETLEQERRFDRFVALGALGAMGAFALGLPGLAAAANRVPVWRLDAVHRPGVGGYASGCAGCHACRQHALNRIFATKAAATDGRAHAGCNCRVVRASLPAATFEKLFGPADKPTRDVVDRRWPKVRSALKTSRKAK